MVRTAYSQAEFEKFFPEGVASYFAPSQVLVDDEEGEIKGAVVLFDSCHDVLYVDHLCTTSKSSARRLCMGIREYAKTGDYSFVYCVSSSLALREFLEAQGAYITEDVTYRAAIAVT